MRKTPALLPHREYLKIYRMLVKLDRQFTRFSRCPVLMARIIKKTMVLVNRAKALESAMSVPKNRRYTNGWS